MMHQDKKMLHKRLKSHRMLFCIGADMLFDITDQLINNQ